MLSNGSFPILKFVDSSGSMQFEINHPIMTVGRDKASNKYVLQTIIFQEIILQFYFQKINIR